jgi:hypothetical protein
MKYKITVVVDEDSIKKIYHLTKDIKDTKWEKVIAIDSYGQNLYTVISSQSLNCRLCKLMSRLN